MHASVVLWHVWQLCHDTSSHPSCLLPLGDSGILHSPRNCLPWLPEGFPMHQTHGVEGGIKECWCIYQDCEGNGDSHPMGGQGADGHRASNLSSQKAYLHTLGGGCKRNQDKLGGKGPPSEIKEVCQVLQGWTLLPQLPPQSCLPAKTLNRGWWHGGLLGCSCLLIFLPFISIFPTLWLGLSSLPLPYFTYPLIHSSPIL